MLKRARVSQVSETFPTKLQWLPGDGSSKDQFPRFSNRPNLLHPMMQTNVQIQKINQNKPPSNNQIAPCPDQKAPFLNSPPALTKMVKSKPMLTKYAKVRAFAFCGVSAWMYR